MIDWFPTPRAAAPPAHAGELTRRQGMARLRAAARHIDDLDPTTAGHSERVAELAARVAIEVGWSGARVRRLREAALVHDVGKVREFSYGAEFELTEEGRLLGHLAIGAEIVGAGAGGLDQARRAALLHCLLTHHGPEPARGGGSARGFGSPEALALQRLNALDAGVKGALERGL